jgi:ubiquinone/menaquinone biosynthesis C-methylase UbiE
MTALSVIKLQSEEHEIIDPNFYASREEYVIHLMHLSDYKRAQFLVKNKNVLDLGCNSGYGTNLLAEECKSIIGVDVSPEAIKTADLKYNKPNLEFQLVDGINLPFEDNSFDVIISFQVIEHLVDYDTYFKEVQRVLRLDGILLLTTPNAEIRLQPGQKPWNRFHVHEFRGVELNEFLHNYFTNTQVIGQFANGSAYALELARCAKARDAATQNKKFHLKNFLINHLPKSLANLLRLIKRKIYYSDNKCISREVKSEFNLSDFYYTNLNLDESLSLVAICTLNITTQATALHAFIPNARDFYLASTPSYA